jgi:hypothetical protein
LVSSTPTINTALDMGQAAGHVLSFTLLTAPFTTPPLTSTTAFFTLSGLSVLTNAAAAGGVIVHVVDNQGATNFDMFTGVSIGTIAGNTTTIFGADGTPDGTVAQEFLNAYPYNAVLGSERKPERGSRDRHA